MAEAADRQEQAETTHEREGKGRGLRRWRVRRSWSGRLGRRRVATEEAVGDQGVEVGVEVPCDDPDAEGDRTQKGGQLHRLILLKNPL